MSRISVLVEADAERRRQDQKWGEQNHASVLVRSGGIIPANHARSVCDAAAKEGRLDWQRIAIEELAEAVDAADDVERREELVQLAAVCVAWIECIDRRAETAQKEAA